MEIAAVVVVYNSNEKSLLENINSYLEDVKFLAVVDNSDVVNNYPLLLDLSKKSKGKVNYIRNGQNLGIAEALNIGAKHALERGYEWLLTMDQDSRATAGMVNTLVAYLESGDAEQVGIISPVHMQQNSSVVHEIMERDFEERLTVMTSGNIISLKAFTQVGGFDTSLFIDYVDHEYCLRLIQNGFKVVAAKKAILLHSLGSFKNYKVANVSNHNYVRRYYITRNRLFVWKKYYQKFPAFCRQDYYEMWKELLKICLFERDKMRKIRAFLLGYYHFLTNKFGKLKG